MTVGSGDNEVSRGPKGKRVKTLALSAVAALVVSTGGAFAAAPSQASDAGGGEPPGASWSTSAICLVPKGAPAKERNLRVPSAAVTPILRSTLSYRGPCAEYGESAPRGDGTLTSYSQTTADGKPVAVGLSFTEETLEGLPYDPPTEGKWCYDKDEDGTTDPMTECAGGYEDALHLGKDFRSSVDSPFTYVLANWNPMGHMPPGVYDRAHFDVHFYMNPNEERLAIRPGPCPALVHCGDYPKGKDLPDERYRHADFEDLDAVEPAMGNHLTDTTAPEHHGEDFTHAFIYGTWDDEVTFYEPMITHDWYSGLVDGSVESGCHEIKQPRAWKESGWYPTEYCMRYRDNREELTTTLEGFRYRHAG